MADTPVIEFSNTVTVEEFNTAFNDSWQDIVDDNLEQIIGKAAPDKNTMKARFYRLFLDSSPALKITVDGQLALMYLGRHEGDTYHCSYYLTANINGSKAHLHDNAATYFTTQRDWSVANGIMRVATGAVIPSSSYDYYYITERTALDAVATISEEITETRVDGKQLARHSWQYYTS